jgi:protein involved in polysaccharide export with SLBB domain
MKKMKLILDRIVYVVCLLVAVGWLGGGCATASDPDFTSAPIFDTSGSRSSDGTNSFAQPYGENPRFQVGDMVIVTFSGISEPLAPHAERIKEDGNITLPLIGAVKAVGKTSGELQKEIHGLYVPKYYVRLTVTVTQSGPDLVFYVTGEVRVPGPKPHNAAGVTVTQAISSAGGPTEFARKGRVQLKRANGTSIRIDYDKALRDPKFDPKVFPGDSIHVPRRPI